MSLFYLLAIAAMFSGGLQNCALIPFQRGWDALSWNFWRGLSIILSGFFALVVLHLTFRPFHFSNEWTGVHGALPLLLLSAGLVTFSNLLINAGIKYLPAGVVHALAASFWTVVSIPAGIFIAGDRIGLPESIAVVVLCLSAVALGFSSRQGNGSTALKNKDPVRGFLLMAAYGFIFGVGYTILGRCARSVDPLLIGYLWESLIALFGGALCILRLQFFPSERTHDSLRRAPENISQFLRIMLACSPTLLATGLSALAFSLGPVSVVGAISCGQLAIVALYGQFCLRERLRFAQWLWVVLIIAELVILRSVI